MSKSFPNHRLLTLAR